MEANLFIKTNAKKLLINITTITLLHLISYVDLLEFIKDTYTAWRKTHIAPNAFAT